MLSTKHVCAFALLLWVTYASAQALPEIFQPDPRFGNDIADVELQVQSKDCPSWTGCIVIARGTYKGSQVGIQVAIKRSEQRVLKIEYRSLGVESDRLLAALAELYKVPLREARFKPVVVARVIPLDANNDELASKVFIAANGPESEYAELYTNINLKRGVVQVREKDESYRENVIKAFAR